MQQSLSVVLERNALLSGEFTTEPYEAAWAREARWFIHALEVHDPAARLEAVTQISPDGLHWCDLGDDPKHLDDAGLTSWSVHEFGGWLRLKGTVTNPSGATRRA